MRAKFVNEKFKEQTDPIDDMKIVKEHINEKFAEEPQWKPCNDQNIIKLWK